MKIVDAQDDIILSISALPLEYSFALARCKYPPFKGLDMGLSNTKLPRDDLREYADITYFEQREIDSLSEKFEKLAGEDQIGKDFFDLRINIQQLKQMRELANNPFLPRMYKVFTTNENGMEGMSFDDFLDLLNCFHTHAPFKLRSYYAFRIFDIDNDGDIDKHDIENIIKTLFKNQDGLGDDDLLMQVVERVMDEADMDETGRLSEAEFKHVLMKCDEFMKQFKIRVKI